MNIKKRISSEGIRELKKLRQAFKTGLAAVRAADELIQRNTQARQAEEILIGHRLGRIRSILGDAGFEDFLVGFNLDAEQLQRVKGWEHIRG